MNPFFIDHFFIAFFNATSFPGLFKSPGNEVVFNGHIMNANYAKFPKKFDSRTISGELP